MVVQIVKKLLIPILIFVLLVVTSYSNISASYRSSITNTATYIQITPTPDSQAEWIIAGDNKTNDWDIYLTGDSITGISGIAPDKKIIWAASDGGLLRWERETGKVTQYLAPTFPIPSNNLSQVLLYEEKLYISGYGGIAIFDQQDQWEVYSSKEIGLEDSYFVPIAIIEGELWVGGENKIARLLPDGRWEILSFEGFTFYHIEKIISDSDKSYVVVALGIGVQDERQVLRFFENSWEIVADSRLSHFRAPDGSLWLGGADGLAKSSDEGRTWETIIETERYIQPRAFDDQGRIYAATSETIFVIEEDQVTKKYQFTTLGPELNYINILKWDKQNRLWIATDGRGMTMFDGEEWFNWQPKNSHIRESAIRGLAIGDSKIYASAGSGGVNIFDLETEQWTNLWPGESELSGGDGGAIAGIAVDNQGRAFFPTAAGILDIYDGQEWQHIPIPIPNVSRIDAPVYFTGNGAFDQEGNYWVGIDGAGLWEYDGTDWVGHHIQGSVNAFAFDQDNRLWVASSAGVAVRDQALNWYFYTLFQFGLGDNRDNWRFYTSSEPGNSINGISIDENGRAWMVTRNHLLVFNGREFQTFPPQTVGAASWGDALTFDSRGNLWVATDSGLAKFNGEPEIPAFQGLILEPEWVQSDSDLSYKFSGLEQTLTSLSRHTAIMSFCVLLLLVGGTGIYLWFKKQIKYT